MNWSGVLVCTVQITHDDLEKHQDNKLALKMAVAEGVKGLEYESKEPLLVTAASISHTGF